MALEFILSIAPTVFEYTIGPVIRHAGYAFCYARKVTELKNQVEKLAATRGSLQNSAQEDRRRGYEIQPDVENWLTDAQIAIEEAGELTQSEEEEAKKKCFAGWCPNINTRYQLGKMAAKKALAIEGLKNEGKFDRNQISYRPAPQQIVSSSVHGFEGLPSRASIFQAVMDALSDPNVKMIGVYGLGGTGKTTLAKEVRQQADGKLFNVVAMATLSAKPDLNELKEVQGSIADVLGLKFEAESLDGRANQLCRRLMKEDKVLIILDNLSEKIELENLGIPLTNEKWVRGREADSVHEGFQFNSQLESIQQEEKGCKVLMTSRNGRLLTDEMGVQKDFKLDLMTEEESWSLFDRTVGGLETPRLRSIAIKVAKKCGGLPILLVMMAGALKNKEFGLWNDALQRLSTFKDEEIQEKVYSAIEFSYTYLPEEAKSFFLLCGLFPYANISILDLMKYSMGLGILKRIESVRDARNRVQKLIGDLKALCLLSESEKDGRVKIHDIVQGVAASIASRTQFGFKKVGASLEEFQRMDFISCTKLFLEKCDVSMLSLKSQYPAVEFFHLDAEDLSLKIPDTFFEGITKLQVLDFTHMCFSSLPLSLGFLTSLHTLCLDYCTLQDISVITQLKNLEILSLMGSEIVQLPRDLAQLTQLKLLDLSNCSKLKFIPKNVFSHLSLLEELLMGNSFVSWEAKHSDNQSNASLSELEHLSLTNLEIHVPDDKKLPKRLSSKKLERYKILIGNVWDWRGKYQTSRTLKLKLDTSIHLNHGLKTLLKEVEDLYLDDVKGITNVLYDLHSEGFPQLKHLHVQNGREVRHFIDSKRWVSCDAFPALESLTLHNLVNLDKISQGKLLVGDFCRLRILKVRSCNKLKNLFPFSMIRRKLQQLGEMEIMDCSDMEVLFAYENEEVEEEEEDDKNEVVEFTQLYSLKLRLPLLRSICSKGRVSPASANASSSRQKQSAMDPPVMEIESASDTSMPLFNEMIVFPNLKELKLFSIGVNKIWHGQFADRRSFCKLTSLTVEACRNLHYLFMSSMVKSLAQLQRLEICHCESLEVVIATEGKKTDKIPFPNLEFLKLKGLLTLSKFCIGGLIEFPSLKELWIEDCFQLKTFISNPIAGNTGSNLTLFDEKASFPKLEELRIVKMDRIKMIWHNELHGSSFCKLKTVIVESAAELQNIFPSNMLMTRCLNLERVKLGDCALLEEVFNLQLKALMNSRTKGMASSRLKTLRIQNLPNLKHVWNKNPEEGEIISFNDLCVVYARNCPNLKRVFPAYIAMGLLQLESLDIRSCGIEEIIERDDEIEVTARFAFSKLATLRLYNLRKLKALYAGLHISEWPMLKRLDVHDCGNRELFTAESGSLDENSRGSQLDNPLQQPFFSVEKVIPNLEELTLTSKDAQMICHAQFPAHLFDKVTFLHLEGFDAKSASFFFVLLQRFNNLEKLEIKNNWLKEMFCCKRPVSGENQKTAVARMRHMRLRFLYKLKSIWKQEDCQLEQMFENLETLEVWQCNSLISLAPSVACFKNLSHLDVWKCQGLLNLVTSSTAQYVRHLSKLSIRECDTVEEIVAREEDHGREDQMITWANLKTLKLHSLGSLTCFSSVNHTLKFPALEEVIVTRCPKMKAFSGGFAITPKLKRVKLAEGDAIGRWEGDINTTVQQFCVELVGLHGIEHLKLSDFPELKETWHMENFPANVLSKLRSLVVDECVHCSNVVPPHLLRSLDNLQGLEVKNCDSVEEVFDLTLSNAVEGQIGTVPKLNELRLIDLPRFKQVWKEEPKGVFHLKNLKVLKIHNCSTLRNLFTPSMCLGLVRLQEVEVKSCPLIEEIITKGAASGATVDNVVLPPLKSVFLEHLPNLTSFFSGGGTVECPSLKSIAISECLSSFTFAFLNEHLPFDANGVTRAKIVSPNLKELKLSSIRVDKIWNDQFANQSSFCKVTSLTVQACWDLTYLFSSSVVKSLGQLQKLEICDCKLMEKVVINIEGEIIHNNPFPNLEFLKLKGLPKLSTFCIGELIKFLRLEELWIENCLGLKAFISTLVAVTTGSNLSLFDQKVAMPLLKTLQVLNLDRLKMIWHNELHKESFCKLKNLTVKHCRELSKIFPSIMLTRFWDLEQLDVRDCDSLEEVFDLQVLMDIKEAHAKTVTQLRSLYLENLPNLKHIWRENPQRNIYFQSLRSVFVWDCPLLKSIFPASVAKCLMQLELLNIMSCGVEEIIAMEEGGGKESSITRFMFPKLNSLRLWQLPNLDKFYPRVHTTEWPALKALYVYNCDKMKIFSFESQSLQGTCEEEQPDIQVMQPLFSFQEVAPGLEELRLNNEDVTMIWKRQFPANLFDKLKFLALQCFHGESTAFPFEFLHRFHNLEALGVGYSQFKELFASKELFDNEEHKRALAQIRYLKLRNMPVLEQIWNQESQPDLVLPNLEILVLWSCDNLSNLAPSSASFQSLLTLVMKDCHGLVNIVASSTAKSLVQLQTMRIIQCHALTEIVASEGCETEEDVMFRRLVTLELNCLPSLTSFCSANHNFKFPSLTEIIVSQCPKMQFFSKGALSTPKLESVKQTDKDQKGRWHRDLNATIQQLFTERYVNREILCIW